jgi:hypothetical protein
VENALLYLVIVAGVGLMLAGAYGAAPAIFPRRRAHAGAAQIFTLGAAFPLLEEDLAPALAMSAETTTAEAPLMSFGAEEDGGPEFGLYEDAAGSERRFAVGAIADVSEVDEAMLGDLMAEIEGLRSQIEGLRSELGLFTLQTAALQSREATAAIEPRRRNRQPPAALPPPLRRQLVDIRKQRRSA